MSEIDWELAIWPDRAQYRPGAVVNLVAEVRGPANRNATVWVTLTAKRGSRGAGSPRQLEWRRARPRLTCLAGPD